ncbi:MAG: hypothetical protein GY811_19750 [Myxococcales bacterium]|nr:hypothetical protein [Myxococcales bacterium]
MIIIYGASGHTGSLIAEALHGQELEFAMTGRDLVKLQTAAGGICDDVRCAQAHDHDGLVDIFEDADVVVNCAGPFGLMGEGVVRAALAADCHYIDTAGEQDFVRSVYEQFESAARQAGRVIINACAFEVALGDWAANVAAAALNSPIADSISISYAVDNMQPTKGTRLSILDAMGKPGYRWDEDRWVPASPGAERIEVNYPESFGQRIALSFPSPEVITVPRHSPARRVQTFMSLGQDNPLTRAASLVAPVIAPVLTPLLGSLLRTSLGAIAESTIRAAEGARPSEDNVARFAIVAEATCGTQTKRCAIAGENIYRVSAGIACLAAERLQNEGELGGVLTPSELFPPRLALEEIAAQHSLFIELPDEVPGEATP